MKKIFIFLSVFALIICSCCFSVSAASVDYNDTFPFEDSWKYAYYIDINDGFGGVQRFVIYTDNNSVEDETFFDKNITAKFYVAVDNHWTLSLKNNTSSGFIEHYGFNGEQWEQIDSHMGNTEFKVPFRDAEFAICSVIYSDFNVYNEDMTEIVYSKPSPPLSLSDSIKKALSNFTSSLSSSIGIIVLCAVGCLALIVLLSLIPRIIHKFL